MQVKTIAVYTKTTTKNKPSFSEYLSEGSKRHETYCSLLKEHRKDNLFTVNIRRVYVLFIMLRASLQRG